MAAEVCGENWGWAASPRISFSHDLSQKDISPGTPETRRLDGSLPLEYSDFDFSISCEISAQEPSLADELFSHGILLPLPIKTSAPATAQRTSTDDTPAPPAPLLDRQRRGSLREVMASCRELEENDAGNGDCGPGRKSTAQQRPFWRFGRSSSLGGGMPKAGMVCPFPLSRSKSTGSNPNPNPKRRQFSKTTTTSSSSNNSSINSSISLRKTTPSDPGAKTYYYSGTKRGAYGSGMRISPVLNVPAPYFPRGNGGGNMNSSSSLFGYLLCNCSNKSMRRRAVTCSP